MVILWAWQVCTVQHVVVLNPWCLWNRTYILCWLPLREWQLFSLVLSYQDSSKAFIRALLEVLLVAQEVLAFVTASGFEFALATSVVATPLPSHLQTLTGHAIA